MNDLLIHTAERALKYLSDLQNRRVFPDAAALAGIDALEVPFPEGPTDPEIIIRDLDVVGSPATVASAGGRYFGFVTGGALPAAVAANWLATAWDQNPATYAGAPLISRLEAIASKWLLEILNLPSEAGVGFVTGATMANVVALAAARRCLLLGAGWNVESKGLFGAPEIKVVVGDEVHASVLKALSILGFGRDRLQRVATDGQGRLRPDLLPDLNAMTLVCLQAGNVNTGAFDPVEPVCRQAHGTGAWVHVDGAFGLWASASQTVAHLTRGIGSADSWATDAHKWLNVPYDSGLVFVRDPDHIRAAMDATAAYLMPSAHREPMHFTPEMSRRARGVEVYAALRSLGRSGLSDLIARNCRYARRFADGLSEAGYEVLNDVVLNQVLVKFSDAETTRRVIAAVQEEGTMWAGATHWQGQAAMRISVSSWATTDADVEASLAALIREAKKLGNS